MHDWRWVWICEGANDELLIVKNEQGESTVVDFDARVVVGRK